MLNKKFLQRFKYLTIFLFYFIATSIVHGQSSVSIEEKNIVLPTYLIEEADKNPSFYSGRNYQGAQGHVYPYPMYDVLTDNRKDVAYNSIFLENEFLEICVVPDLGGRIFSATDKTQNFDFFYRQHVIKPALIGMTGAWISGGVEWNIPDHHRATSQMQVDSKLIENKDGSKTAWVGETELSRGMKWMVGLTLFPGKAYLEATVKVINTTPFAHPFLYWANVSVHCDENYQVIFPPSTQYGAQHAKGEFTPWPVGDGYYGGADRTGKDLSWWRNHENPASIFAWNFTDDFLAGYDHAKEAGTVHVANHHVVTGKKFFLWGNNEESGVWEKMLTETDGQYLELMVGAYSDNQPDYSWIGPGETRVFKQYWYPIKKIGGVKNANTKAALNLERKEPGTIFFGFNTTEKYEKSKAIVSVSGKKIYEDEFTIDPANPYLKKIDIDPSIKDTEIKVTLLDSFGNKLISYSPVALEKADSPLRVERPMKPEEYKTIEELYMTGLRIEQFKNAVIDPIPYYEEALKRDSLDYRVNTILGIRFCKEGRFSEAEKCLRRAIKRSTKNYTRPKDGEAFYYLGVALEAQNKLTEALDNYWKATWYPGFQSMAYYELAQQACFELNFENALQLIDQSLSTNTKNTAALSTKAFVLRKLGRMNEAMEIINDAEQIDCLDNWIYSEKGFLLASENKDKKWSESNIDQFVKHLGFNVQYALELVNNYGNIGAWDEAIYIIDLFKQYAQRQADYPMLAYFKGFYNLKNNKIELANKCFKEGSEAPSEYCFPWRLEELKILKTATRINPKDSKAWYYLGNLYYYLNQKEDAILAWEQSVNIDDKFSYAYRNLGFAYDQFQNSNSKAISAYEKAIEINNQDAKFFAELDLIKAKEGVSASKRLAFMEKHLKVLENRDDAVIQLVKLYNMTGEYDKALDILTQRHFHVWEGSRDYHKIFVESNLLKGVTLLEKKKYEKALESFLLSDTYPDNLEAGRSKSSDNNVRVNYYIGLAYYYLNQSDNADTYFMKAATFESHWFRAEPSFYKGLALKKLGNKAEADKIFDGLKEFANKQLTATAEKDFFEKFGTKLSQKERQAYNYYLLGLSYLGKNNQNLAIENFQKSVELDQNQVWSNLFKKLNLNL